MADADLKSVRGGRPAEAHGPKKGDGGKARQQQRLRSDVEPDGVRGCSFWSDHIWLTGSDGKARRAQPSISLLAHGIPNRVGKLRAYGNAIVPQVAAEVIGAYMDCAQAWGDGK